MTNQKHHSSKGRTMQYHLIMRFISVLVIALSILSAAITVMTILSIYDSTKERTNLLLSSLSKSDAETVDEWQSLLETHIPNDNSPNFIRVALTSGDIVYSQDAHELYQQFPQFKHLFFAKRILWEDMEPYYYRTLELENARISVLVEMEDSFEIIGKIISFTFMLTILVIVIGGLVTYRFAKRISHSLNKMNQEIMELSQKGHETRLLTEPREPLEVANISTSFNSLISKQRASLEREKQFVADASHELRTPLTAIRGHVNLIKRRGTEHPEVIPRSIAYLDKESKRMEILVEQLLTLGRQERGSELIPLSKLVEDMIAEFQVLYPKRIELVMSDKVNAIGNQEHYYQIVRNLLENALKYSGREDIVTVTLSEANGRLKLVVADTGIGISSEDQAHIFERFYRADQSRSSSIPGSGVGLAIVKELVERYEGKIRVENNQPRGSRFIVDLPKA